MLHAHRMPGTIGWVARFTILGTHFGIRAQVHYSGRSEFITGVPEGHGRKP